VPLVDDLFRDLDARWGTPPPAKIRLRIIGSSALMLQTDYERGTTDSDVLETTNLSDGVRKRMLYLAGEGTTLHQRHRLYIQIVPSGIPFLPQVALYHPLAALNAELSHFDIEVLDVVDVVVAKLKRFHAADRADIDAMVKKGFVPHQRLVARFRDSGAVATEDAPSSRRIRDVTPPPRPIRRPPPHERPRHLRRRPNRRLSSR
jgi:uncharacterized nucleotidyltransferase DUF6036